MKKNKSYRIILPIFILAALYYMITTKQPIVKEAIAILSVSVIVLIAFIIEDL